MGCTYILMTNDTRFEMRASADWLKAVDEWRRHQPDIPARAEAIRRLVELGLKFKKERSRG